MTNRQRKTCFTLAPIIAVIGLVIYVWLKTGVATKPEPAPESVAGEAAHRYTNRLIDATSPYLLQHAHNPVDWYPWGQEAFDKARRENKPIFLSVGYSTCHWCHVMERESFENPAIAAIMNRHFVNIKVDREERPDVDRVYMTFVQATTGGGGWPMSVWLTPDLKPFFGSTYFPPEDRYGRPGFPSVLRRIAELWETEREKIVAQGDQVIAALQQFVNSEASAEIPGPDVMEKAFQQIAENFDARHGGFGGAPKFPRPSTLNFLFAYARWKGPETPEGKQAIDMAVTTLRKMAAGGIHDHLGGGFHRYAVDAGWHVPHFEKMLYDQAQLTVAYLEGFQLTKDGRMADVARNILAYVARDMTSAEGGFFSAEDADSLLAHGKPEHAEGAFYVWSKEEIDRALAKDEAEVFSYVYDAQKGGNVVEDPHGEFKDKNILIQRHTVEEAAGHFGRTEAEVAASLEKSRATLFEARKQRPRPHIDDKIITAWNGLMISAFSRAHEVLGDTNYLARANQAAEFVRARLYDTDRKVLYRSFRDGRVSSEGFADDYAFLIQGLLDLHQAGGGDEWLKWAVALQEKQDELFLDDEAGGYFSHSGDDPSILLKLKEDYDGAEPSPNSVAALNLLRLAKLTGEAGWKQRAESTIAAFSSHLSSNPYAMPQMLMAMARLSGQQKTQ